MKKIKRVVSVLCALSILFSTGYAYKISFFEKIDDSAWDILQANLLRTENGFISIEAEDCLRSESTEVLDDDTASNGQYVNFTKGTTSVSGSDAGPTILAEFVATQTASYSMWARVKAASTGSDSVYWAFNSAFRCTSYVIKDSFTISDQWQWVKFGAISIAKGKARFELKYREKNFMVDKFIFTTDESFAPTGANDIPEAVEPSEGSNVQMIFPEPQIKPITGHPRVFLTSDYIKELKDYVTSPEIAAAWKSVKDAAAKMHVSELPESSSGNFNSAVTNWLQCRALLYVMGEKDAVYAKETIRYARNVLRTVIFSPTRSDVSRQMGIVMTMGAIVYDWCYDQMTEDDKEYFITRFKEICALKEISYPPQKDVTATGSHMGEYEIHRDMLSCGIACYDEDPEMYELAAGALYSRFVASRKMFNAAGSHPNGSSYGLFRLGCELYADLLFTRMGYPAIYGKEIESVMMRYIYARRPDGLFLKDGDDSAYSLRTTVTAYHASDWTPLIILNGLYDDPYVRGQYLKMLSRKGYTEDAFWVVICADPDKDFKQPDDLPLAMETTSPLSAIFHRTSWQPGMDSEAALVQFKAYERNLGDHMHLDAGSFQLYYKGALAIDAGNYQGESGGWDSDHAFNYANRSIAHNVVTVYDPNEVFTYAGKTYANDGGQRMRVATVAKDYDTLMNNADYLYAENKGSYIGPNEQTPAFSYLKANLTPAYSDKITEYTRSMVFMDLFDEDYPAAFVVFDNVTSSDKSFDKKWLLHSIEEPKVAGNTTSIARTEDGYNGKLVNKTFLPASYNIEKVGGEGKEAYVDGTNYPNKDTCTGNSEQGQWRLEISPTVESTNDLFLNAMYVTDNDETLPELPMYQESMSGFVGVTVKDRMVLFRQDAKTQTEQFTLNIRDHGYDEVMCFVADVAKGTWNISGEGVSINVESKEGEEALCFTVKPGNYVVKKTSASAVALAYPEMKKEKFGDFIVYNKTNGCYLRCENPNQLIDGVAYVPVTTLFKQLGATVTVVTSESAVATKGQNTINLYKGAASYVLNGKTINLSGKIIVQDGIMLVPIEGFEDFFGYAINYDSIARILDVSIP